MRTPPGKTRQSELAKIHLAKKQLGLDEETYRAVVSRISARFRSDPVDSAGEMTEAERGALLDEFRRIGFQSAPPAERAADWVTIGPTHPGAQHLRKLLACAYELERIGAVKANRTSIWLRAFIKRQTGCDALQWLTAEDANKVIEGLKGWRKKFLLKHPIEEKQPAASAAIPASAIVKAAVFDAMKLAAEPGSPIEGIRNFLVVLNSQKFDDVQIANQVAEEIRDFGVQARQALLYWDFRKVRSELLRLVRQVMELDPSIGEGMLTMLRPEPGEMESLSATRRPGHKSKRGGSQ